MTFQEVLFLFASTAALVWLISAVFMGKIALGIDSRGAPTVDVRRKPKPKHDPMTQRLLDNVAERKRQAALEASNAPPLPAWATNGLDLEPAPLTHESAWRARETLRRLDPARAMWLDEIVPLEPPPEPSAVPPLSEQVEAAATYRPVPPKDGSTKWGVTHEHPARLRLEQIVAEVDAFVDAHRPDERGEVSVTCEEAEALRLLVKEGEAVKRLIAEEESAQREARLLEELETRKSHAVRSLADLREQEKSWEDHAARTGKTPEVRRALRVIRLEIGRHKRMIGDCDRGLRAAQAPMP